MAATTAGALKLIIEQAQLGLAAYRDRSPKEAALPYVTIDEAVVISAERHGDTSDPNGHHGEAEQLTVHLWERWRGDDGRPAEDYALARDLTHALRTLQPFVYGDGQRVYGAHIDARARLVEDEANVVHTALTITLRRDA